MFAKGAENVLCSCWKSMCCPLPQQLCLLQYSTTIILCPKQRTLHTHIRSLKFPFFGGVLYPKSVDFPGLWEFQVKDKKPESKNPPKHARVAYIPIFQPCVLYAETNIALWIGLNLAGSDSTHTFCKVTFFIWAYIRK